MLFQIKITKNDEKITIYKVLNINDYYLGVVKMANTKTQKELKISNVKSEYITEFILEIVNWKILMDELNVSKSALFRQKKQLKDLSRENGAFEALSELFTIKEMNIIIRIYNDYRKNPDKYEPIRKSKKVNLEEQKNVANKHLSSMNMHYDEPEIKNEENNK